METGAFSLFICPRCGESLTPPEEGWEGRCDQCGKHMDLHGQFAYKRGYEAFTEAQAILEELRQVPRRKTSAREYVERERNAYSIFSEAYTALQEAFRHDLSRDQLEHCVEMMINMSQLFVPRGMVSATEASYWGSLMYEQNARREYEALGEKLARARGLRGFLRGWRWRMRRGQLRKALAYLDHKILQLEDSMHFAHSLRAYRGRH